MLQNHPYIMTLNPRGSNRGSDVHQQAQGQRSPNLR